MDYKFTSDMEEKLDDIAEGKIKWLKVMKDFYKNFHPSVEKITDNLKELIKKNKKTTYESRRWLFFIGRGTWIRTKR